MSDIKIGWRAFPGGTGLFGLLPEWAPKETMRHRILVENPEALQGFTKSA